MLKGGNASTGCGSLSMDPKHPDTLFASLWDFRRKGWTFRSGGPDASAVSGSGLYRSDDGGSHWTELTEAANKGLPAKPYGRIAVAMKAYKSLRMCWNANKRTTATIVYISPEWGIRPAMSTSTTWRWRTRGG